MFGLSFAKLLVLVVAIAGIIALFRLVSVLKRQQELARRQDRDRPPRRTRGRTPNEQAQIRDMAACGRCGAYIAAEAGGCGRRDCPFRHG